MLEAGGFANEQELMEYLEGAREASAVNPDDQELLAALNYLEAFKQQLDEKAGD